MAIIYWLIPLTIIILVVAVIIFFWAIKNGQYDDLDSPAVNILLDDDLQQKPNKTTSDAIVSNSETKN